jgi:hypothetical protein
LKLSRAAELSGKVTSAGIDWDNLTFKENRKRVKTKARKLEILKADFEKQVRVHAEIQILMQLVDGTNDKKSGLKEFDYNRRIRLVASLPVGTSELSPDKRVVPSQI